MHISSRQNQRVKEAAKLRNRKARNQQKRFVVDGVREINRAISAGVTFPEAFFLLQNEHSSLDSSQLQQLSEQLEAQGTENHTVTADVFDKLSFGDRAEGVVAVAQTWLPTLSSLTLPEKITRSRSGRNRKTGQRRGDCTKRGCRWCFSDASCGQQNRLFQSKRNPRKRRGDFFCSFC